MHLPEVAEEAASRIAICCLVHRMNPHVIWSPYGQHDYIDGLHLLGILGSVIMALIALPLMAILYGLSVTLDAVEWFFIASVGCTTNDYLSGIMRMIKEEGIEDA